MQDQRLQYILDQAKDKRIVTVQELAEQLVVSPMTVRRDLNLLCQQGKLERCYGGARLPQSVVEETAYSEKLLTHRAEKQRIARRALELVQEGDVLYMDSGTTVGALASLLAQYHMRVTVVTNEVTMAGLLAQAQIETVVVGGVVNSATGSVSGRLSEQFLRQFRFSKAFLGASSIDYEFNTFSPNLDKAYLKRLAMELATESYLLADSSKFYSSALCLVTSLDQYTSVITDKQFTGEEQHLLKEGAITILSC